MKRLPAIQRVLTNRRILAAAAAFTTYAVVLHGAWVGLVLYAYNEGGVGEAGVVAFAVLLPASLLGPFVAAWLARLQPNASLSGGLLLQAVTVGVAALIVGFDLASWLVYVSMGVFSTAQMATRPSIAATLPRIVDDPAELAASNSAIEMIETLGLVVGPGVAGVVLLTSDAQGLFVVCALTLCFGALAGLGVGRSDDIDDLPAASVMAEVRSGVDQVRSVSPVRQLVALLLVVKLIIGILEVAIVPIALDQLMRSEAAVGLLGVALGAGGIAGAALSFLLVGRRRLTPVTVASVLVASVPLIAVAVANSLTAVVALLAVAGIGRPVVAVGGRTLLQSLSSEDTIAQLFGFLEGVSMLAVAIGGVLFAVVAEVAGLQLSLVLCGVIPAAAALWLYRPLDAVDRDRPAVDPERLALVRSVPIFAPLSAFRLEQLMANLVPASAPAHAPIFAKGDAGDQFYLVADGSAIVELPNRETEVGAGEFFGEMALIDNAPRMAGVRSGPHGLEAFTLSGDVFIGALSSVASSRRRAERIVDERLASNEQQDPPPRPDPMRRMAQSSSNQSSSNQSQPTQFSVTQCSAASARAARLRTDAR